MPKYQSSPQLLQSISETVSARSPHRERSAAASGRKQIALALQGGGSHGAFTWGVLDRLLEEPSLEIVGVSGTSAGAMNAGVLAHGLRGGAGAAREALRGFWEALGRMPGFATLRSDPKAIRVFIGTTNVRTGRRRVFENGELSPDVLLASACLPLVFQA